MSVWGHNISSSGMDNTGYLQLHVSKLKEFQMHVLLIINEIYIYKCVKYSTDEINGLAADGAVALTLLCFMVKSVTGKYKDLETMFPIATLTAATLNDCYNNVMDTMCKVRTSPKHSRHLTRQRIVKPEVFHWLSVQQQPLQGGQ